jgi:exodeoxyribonuclease VII large subunit
MTSLFDLNQHIRRVVALNFQQPLWIAAELAQVGQSRGHYYLDLVQKGEGDDVLAQAQAVLWATDYRRLYKALGPGLEAVLQEGLAVKLCVRVDFHERYGLKLQITDIDPAYTLGQISMQRRETVEALRRLGLFERNRSLALPPVLQRIAVISSEGAAGFQDFREHLAQNPYQYDFNCVLFNTAVQGKNTGSEVQAAVSAIESRHADFDAVVIIRGGGAKLDLAAFDSLDVCRPVAGLPIPVLAGIGHDVDETVLDQVVHTSLKTPTAVADFLLQHNLQFESDVLRLAGQVRSVGDFKVKIHQGDLLRMEQTLHWSIREQLRAHAVRIDQFAQVLPGLAVQALRQQAQQLAQAELICQALHPDNVLRRGFSITTKNGKIIASAAEVEPGDVLETRLQDGTVKSVGI